MNALTFYEADGQKIAVKRFTENGQQSIIFIDVATDGLAFSHTITANYSKKNIENFLKTKFKKIKKCN